MGPCFPVCPCRSYHLSLLLSLLTQEAVLPSPLGIKGWVVLGQPGGFWGRDMELSWQEWNPGASRVRQLWSGIGPE